MPEQTPPEPDSSSTDPTVKMPREEISDSLSKLRASSNEKASPESAAPQETNTSTEPGPSTTATVQSSGQEPAAAPAAKANILVPALGTLAATLIQTWKGDTVGALRTAGNSNGFALVATAVYAVIGGLLSATILTRGLGSVDDLADGLTSGLSGGSYSSSGMFSATAGQWITAFILGAIMMGLVYILRALCVKWVFSVRGAGQSFGTSLSIVAGSYSIPMALLLVATLLFMIPSLALSALVMFAIAILALPVGMIPEIMIYIGINRTHRFTKSPLIPHVSFTLVWVIILAIAYMIVGAFFAEALS